MKLIYGLDAPPRVRKLARIRRKIMIALRSSLVTALFVCAALASAELKISTKQEELRS